MQIGLIFVQLKKYLSIINLTEWKNGNSAVVKEQVKN